MITFTTYGTRLHGDGRGSVDPKHNIPGTPFLDSDTRRVAADRKRFKHPPITLDAPRRRVVHNTIVQVCAHRGWLLHTLNVRTNHVHVLVSAGQTPERVMNSLKSWATRRLTEAGLLPIGTRVWTRHGSTRYLWKDDELEPAGRYVRDGQGPDLPGA